MSEYKAIIIFVLIVFAAVVIAAAGIMFNVRKAAKLFKDDENQDDEPDEKS